MNKHITNHIPKVKIVVVSHSPKRPVQPTATKTRRPARIGGRDLFRRFSAAISNRAGTPWAFVLAFSVVVLWASSGWVFNYSNTWQLMINTTTTIVTFLMVFIIQNTQNRDGKAVHLKLDELLSTQHGARPEFVDAEDLSDDEIAALQDQFKDIHADVASMLERGVRSRGKKT